MNPFNWYLSLIVAVIISRVKAECGIKPVWKAKLTEGDRHLIADWLLEDIGRHVNSHFDYPSFDGWYHNLAKIQLGAVGQPLFKGWKGIRMDASNVKSWSKVFNQTKPYVSMCKDSSNGLAFILGRQVANEILKTGVAVCGEKEGLNQSRIERNYATPYIDGGAIYGNSWYWASKYISFENGSIESGKVFFKNKEDAYSIILKDIWTKWHNFLAKRIHKAHPKCSGEKIFNEARKFTIAVQQKVYVYEWLPAWINENLAPYERYDPLVDPQVEKLFQVAMHFLQSTVVNSTTLLCQNLFQKTEYYCPIEGLKIASCKGYEEFKPITNMEQYFVLPDVNHARKAFMLPVYQSLKIFLSSNDVKISPQLTGFLKDNIENLDSMLGGTLESRSGPGQLFTRVILDQFRRIRDGDRFWFENIQNTLFKADEICKIRSISFLDVLLTVTNVSNGFLNDSIFHQYKDPYLTVRNVVPLKHQTLSNKDWTLVLLLVEYCLALVTSVACLIILQRCSIKTHKIPSNEEIITTFRHKWQVKYPLFLVHEYLGNNEQKRLVLMVLNKAIKQIVIYSIGGTLLRAIELDKESNIEVLTTNRSVAILKSSGNYELVLNFKVSQTLSSFLQELDVFIFDTIKKKIPTVTSVKWKIAKQNLVTHQQHRTLLEMFFRVAFAQVFKIEHSIEEILVVDTATATEVVDTKLTIVEFAECLRMSPENEFIKKMFSLIDRDQKQLISFRSFLDVMILFARGKEETKAHLFFKLYDIDGTGVISTNNFKAMLSSFMEIVGDKSTSNNAQSLLHQCGINHKTKLDFRDFKTVIRHEIANLSRANFDSYRLAKNDQSYLAKVRQTFQSIYSDSSTALSKQYKTSEIDKEQENPKKPLKQFICIQKLFLFCNKYSNKLFWHVPLTLLIAYVFVDKLYYFYRTSNLIGINKYMFAFSKGASHAIMLTYAAFILTMCEHVFARLQDTFYCRYFPFKSLQGIRCYLGWLLAIFTLIHIVGKTRLFMWFMSLPSDDACTIEVLDEEIGHILEFRWLNPVNISGLLLLIPLIVLVYHCIQVFAGQNVFNIYYLQPFIIILLVIHGSLSQFPLLHSTLLAPLIIFIVDSIMGITITKITLPLWKTEFLASNVICLTLKRPINFQYSVGQWVRLAINEINPHVFHQFILSSAPSEATLRIHVQPTEPYARQLRTLIETEKSPASHVCIDGPYGASLQKWRYHEVTVLIASSTGVKLFASILKDVVHVLKTKSEVPCNKVYFLWISKTQKYFEWMMDLIREVEDCDLQDFFSGHIFITENYGNFDLRTIMLMICEKHYKRISGKGIFTGLRARVHFKKPEFSKVFQTIQNLHNKAGTIGVFSSGPVSLTSSISSCCNQKNMEVGPRFEHWHNY